MASDDGTLINQLPEVGRPQSGQEPRCPGLMGTSRAGETSLLYEEKMVFVGRRASPLGGCAERRHCRSPFSWKKRPTRTLLVTGTAFR